MSKFSKLILYVLFGISIVIGVIFFFNTSSESMVSLILNWSYVLFFICIIVTLIMPMIYGAGKSKKGALVKVGIVLVVCVISYLLASGNPVDANVAVEPSKGTLKWVDTGLILSCILLVCAFLSIFSGAFMNLFRKN